MWLGDSVVNCQGSYVGAMIGQIWGEEIHGQVPVLAESGRLGRHAGRQLVSLVKASGPPLLWGCFGPLWSFPPLVCQSEHYTAHQVHSNSQTHTLGCPVTFPFQGLGSLLFPVDGNWGGLSGKSPSLYCSKSWAKHLSLYLSKLTFGMKPVLPPAS